MSEAPDASASLDASAQAGPLAEAAARLARLLPVRATGPAHAGVLLRADGDGLLLVAADGEVSARLRVPAVVHGRGEVLVSRRGLAETVAALGTPEIRLVAEGSRLAVRTPGARFALPSLGTRDGRDAHRVAAALPRRAGQVAGSALRAAVAPVAGAASREHALPIPAGPTRSRCTPRATSLGWRGRTAAWSSPRSATRSPTPSSAGCSS